MFTQEKGEFTKNKTVTLIPSTGICKLKFKSLFSTSFKCFPFMNTWRRWKLSFPPWQFATLPQCMQGLLIICLVLIWSTCFEEECIQAMQIQHKKTSVSDLPAMTPMKDRRTVLAPSDSPCVYVNTHAYTHTHKPIHLHNGRSLFFLGKTGTDLVLAE